MDGMHLLRQQRGLMARVALELGVTRAAVSTWQRIPADRLADVSRITGIPAADLRPDLAMAFAQPAQAPA